MFDTNLNSERGRNDLGGTLENDELAFFNGNRWVFQHQSEIARAVRESVTRREAGAAIDDYSAPFNIAWGNQYYLAEGLSQYYTNPVQYEEAERVLWEVLYNSIERGMSIDSDEVTVSYHFGENGMMITVDQPGTGFDFEEKTQTAGKYEKEVAGLKHNRGSGLQKIRDEFPDFRVWYERIENNSGGIFRTIIVGLPPKRRRSQM